MLNCQHLHKCEYHTGNYRVEMFILPVTKTEYTILKILKPVPPLFSLHN